MQKKRIKKHLEKKKMQKSIMPKSPDKANLCWHLMYLIICIKKTSPDTFPKFFVKTSVKGLLLHSLKWIFPRSILKEDWEYL